MPKTAKTATEKFDIKEDFAEKFIKSLEQGIIPWHKEWLCANRPTDRAFNRITNKTASADKIANYSITNQIYLWMQFGDNFAGEWASFDQWKAEGYAVKKGEKGSKIVFYKQIVGDKKDKDGNVITDKDGKPVKAVIPILKYKIVFHNSQVQDKDGNAPTPYHDCKKVDMPNVAQAGTEAETVLKDYLDRNNIALRYGGDKAYYSPSQDCIQLPAIEQFVSTHAYISTFAHESGHSTGHASRLHLLDKVAGFGTDTYGKEELRAEMISAWFCNTMGLEQEIDSNHIAYCQSWRKAVEDYKKSLITIISNAEKGLRMILNLPDKIANERERD